MGPAPARAREGGADGLGAGRGHWGCTSGDPSGSAGCGPDPGSASSASSSDATPSSSRKTWRTVRVVKVRGTRLWGGGETRGQRLNDGSREKSERQRDRERDDETGRNGERWAKGRGGARER